uniref:Uncharacterized protein n=1 Tax=Haemonchus contortus TaxID=6289 RepID=A0A7I4YQK0_HAECO
MAFASLHSQLLFILLVSYFNLCFFILIAGLKDFDFGGAEKTLRQLEEDLEAVKVLVSLCLHAVSIVCILVCIGLLYTKKKESSIVILAILAFVLFFNIVAAILLFIFHGKENKDKDALNDCGFLSTAMILVVAGIGVLFVVRPPSLEHNKPREQQIIPLQNQGVPQHGDNEYFDPPR